DFYDTFLFFFSSRRRHTRSKRDWSSDVCSSDLTEENTRSEDLGVIYGSGIGGLTTIQEQIIKMHEKGPQRVSPMFVPTAIANMRSEERRVGKECKSRRWRGRWKKKGAERGGGER